MKSSLLLYIGLHLIVVAVFLSLEKYFVSEPASHTWHINHYGSLKQFQPISGTKGVGISEFSDLVTIDLANQSILSSIDLKDTDSDTYVLLDNIVVTYSTTSSTIHIFERYSGIFIEKIRLDAPPVHFGEFYDNGLLILDSKGSLIAWNKTVKKLVGKYNERSFKSSLFDGLFYASIGPTVMCLNDQAENIISNVRTSSDILDLKDGLAVSQNEVLILRGTKGDGKGNISQTKSFSFVNPRVISSQIVADLESERFTLYKVVEGHELEMITQHAAHDASEIRTIIYEDKVFVVSYLSNGCEIHDFSKLVHTFSFNDIVSHERLFADNEGELFSFYDQNEDAIQHMRVTKDQAFVTTTLLSSDDIESSVFELTETLPRQHAILINKPRSATEIEKAHYLSEESHIGSPFIRMLLKIKHHLAQLWRFIVYFSRGGSPGTIPIEDTYGFQKLLISFDDRVKELKARNSQTQKVTWISRIPELDSLTSIESLNDKIYLSTPLKAFVIDARDGRVENVREFPMRGEKTIKLSIELPEEMGEEGYEPFALGVKCGTSIFLLDADCELTEGQYFLEERDGKLQSYKITDHDLVPTWSYAPQNEILLTFSHNEEKLTPATGIAKARRTVLYKYLNPNLVTIVTHNNGNNQITVHLLDGVTGTVLYVQKLNEISIDPSTIQVVQRDNWVVLSYIDKDDYKQILTVLDLFGTVANASGGEKSVFSEFDIKIHNVLSKSYIFPEKINLLGSTSTKVGITTKSLIAVTESGSMVEIPKYLVNSRRIDDRPLTQEDFEEFKMMPYDPLIPKPDLHVLNGNKKVHVLHLKGILLTGSTEMESTSVVCYVNEATEFCTVVQPSLSYDILKPAFDKHKLLATIGILYFAFVISKEFVKSKRLNAKWLD